MEDKFHTVSPSVAWSDSDTVEHEPEPKRKMSNISMEKAKLPNGQTIAVVRSTACGWNIALSMGLRRTRNFTKLSAFVAFCAVVWIGMRCWMMIRAENTISTAAWEDLAVSIKNSIKVRVTQDLIYQDSIANAWSTFPKMTRSQFQNLVLSETYEPGLVSMSGISLIFRIVGPEQRALLEGSPDAEKLRQECCNGSLQHGSDCGVVAATGLFCNGRHPRYQVTQFGANGTLIPAVGNDTDYLHRVGQEEYMVVDMIEPFHSNAKVWGFNLLSSDARLAAWRKAMKTGKKTFTRRLNLVQSSVREFGFLVWLPIFEVSHGELWTTAMRSGSSPELLTAVGSVNGVYRAEKMLSEAVKGTFSSTQTRDVTVFLFDSAPELLGADEFLAAYNSRSNNAYEEFKEASIQSVVDKCDLHMVLPLEIEDADAGWTVVVCSGNQFLSEHRTIYPEVTTAAGCIMLLLSVLDRCLGHPAIMKPALYDMDVESGNS